MWIEIDGVMWT